MNRILKLIFLLPLVFTLTGEVCAQEISRPHSKDPTSKNNDPIKRVYKPNASRTRVKQVIAKRGLSSSNAPTKQRIGDTADWKKSPEGVKHMKHLQNIVSQAKAKARAGIKVNERIVRKTEDNAALEDYMEDEPDVSDFIWSDKANERLELVPKGFMRDNTRNRVMLYARSNDIKEITLDVCEAGIRDSVKMMEEAISNGATLEDFLPKKVDA